MRTLLIALPTLAGTLCLAADTAPSYPAVDTKWTQAGWGGGGYYWAAAFHPTRDGVIYLAGDVCGVYKSEDHGRSFRIINNGLVDYGVYSLAVDVKNPETVYAATEGGLCKSTDTGEHWQMLPKTGKKELRITGERGKSIRCIAVDPADGNIVYAGSPAGKVYKSTDGGQTWAACWEKAGNRRDTPADGNVYSVAVAAKDPSLVLAATNDSGVILSSDGGKTWRECETPKKASNVAVAASDTKIIYASFFTDGVWKSVDQGLTWTKVSAGFVDQFSAGEVAVSPVNPQDVYVIGAVGWNGNFYLSHDGGTTWKSSSRLVPDLVGDPTLPKEPNPSPLSSPTNVVINPLKPQELYISANWRSCISEDGGVSWTESMKGADISCIYDIRFSGDRVYSCAMDEGTLVSENNGETWKQLWPMKWTPAISGHNWRLAITPQNGGDRVIATCSPWDQKYPNRIIVSQDGGKTYKFVTEGLPTYIPRANTMWGMGYARALAVDPNDPQVLYLGIDGDPANGNSGGGIFKSGDGGNTWKQLASQPGSRRMFFGLAVDPTDSKRIYWSGCGERGGLYRSEDAGESWQLVGNGETWPFNLMVTADGTVYCGGKNLLRSTDHGTTWKAITRFAAGGRTIVAMEVHPRDPKTLWFTAMTWGGNDDGAVYKTTDGGVTWQDITGDLPYHKPMVLRYNGQTNELWAGGVGLYRTKQ